MDMLSTDTLSLETSATSIRNIQLYNLNDLKSDDSEDGGVNLLNIQSVKLIPSTQRPKSSSNNNISYNSRRVEQERIESTETEDHRESSADMLLSRSDSISGSFLWDKPTGAADEHSSMANRSKQLDNNAKRGTKPRVEPPPWNISTKTQPEITAGALSSYSASASVLNPAGGKRSMVSKKKFVCLFVFFYQLNS
jgi:hypothetical protein